MSLRGALMLAGIVLIAAFPFAGLHLAVLGLGRRSIMKGAGLTLDQINYTTVYLARRTARKL